MPAVRSERDSQGTVEVAADRLWGAQTQRSIGNFPIGRTRYVWGRPVVEALGLVKRAAAEANAELGAVDRERADLIAAAAAEVAAGGLDDHFPLVVFQTGSGTQTNMNANEVIANRAIQLGGGTVGDRHRIHPNDHVNRSQSSNDIFPTVMHVATVLLLRRRLRPALNRLLGVLDGLAAEHADLVKVGRTHLQDATPITLGQEIGAWEAQLAASTAALDRLEEPLWELAVGGTATGTGLNADPRFGPMVAARLSAATGVGFTVTANHFAATSAHDAMANLSGGLRTLAGGLTKMANDIRWLASGPRNGLGELSIPANEPGSSIMPGKVNPTQAEALLMVTAQVFGHDAAVAVANGQGNFQLNVQKPLILHCVLDSIELLADAVDSFVARCLTGLTPDRRRIAENLEANLMLVTALVPHVGYDRAAEIAEKAQREGTSLRAAAVELGGLTADDYDRLVDPAAMTGIGSAPGGD
ncbi:MAG: class II fumarate hydratase [Acidimicrobiales bacterium]